MTVPPPPNGQVLSLVGALSSPENHALHVQAIRARDEALSGSPESYGNLCFQLSCLMAGADQPEELVKRIEPSQLEIWRQNDPTTVLRLQKNEITWVAFGQMAGLILKQALLTPPMSTEGRPLSLVDPAASHVKEVLLYCLACRHAELRAVASSVIATTAVSANRIQAVRIQPCLHVSCWPQLVPKLVSNLEQTSNVSLVQGSLATVRKIMEDGPHELRQDQLDALVPVLIRFLSSPEESSKLAALQSMVACVNEGMMPSALVAHFGEYLGGLSALATDPSPKVRMWVCRSIVTLLSLRTEYVAPHMGPIAQFLLGSTADTNHPEVAVEACEFWLTFASLDDDECTPAMVDIVGALLPQLVPTLLRGMVYLPEQQEDLKFRNELDMQENNKEPQSRPLFHKSRSKRSEGDDESDGDDDEDDDDDEGWTLRKCSAASLDSLASLYGPEPILPALLPSLEEGLSSSDPWVQEASILALGAISDGCRETMNSHMSQLHPYLMTHLSAPESPEILPQVKSIAAWTIGRYASWAVEQVESGAQGHLLAQMTEVFIARLHDRNRRVQVACCSAFGVVIEAAGELMTPYLDPVLRGLVGTFPRYQTKSLLLVLDTIGIIADYVGSVIGEGSLPSIYIPALMHLWDSLAKHDPADRTLLPVMESLASIALVCGSNFQPYALETFENAMCIMESIILMLAASGDNFYNEEDADPIVCAADLIDGLVEGLGPSFATLLSSSQRYGPHFLTMLCQLAQHEIAGVRMSAFAILGDLARNSPSLLEPALPELLKASIDCLDPVQPSVCNNAVWAIGEICVKCRENSSPLKSSAESLVDGLTALLMGNGPGHGAAVPGLAENAAATMGRLAIVDASFVSGRLPRFLLGWCDGMAKISDMSERKDAYEGFIRAVYANPNSIEQASTNPVDVISSIIYAVVSWNMLSEDGPTTDILHASFQPFPHEQSELGDALGKLLRDMKSSVGDQVWHNVQKQLPVNVRQLLRESYHV